MSKLIRHIIRKVLLEDMPLRHKMLSKSVDKPLDISGEAGDTISGKEIMNSTPNGYLYHGSHNPNLNKSNVRLFSKGTDLGNIDIGDRYGFYVSPDIKEVSQYMWGWVKSDDLVKLGKNLVNKMEPNALNKLISLVKSVSKTYGTDKSSFDPLDYAMIGAIYKGLWPSLYKVTVVDDARFVPKTDLDITHDEYAELTQLNKVKGIGGIYAGELGGRYGSYAKHNEMAILNRNAIKSMERVGDYEFWSIIGKFKDPLGGEIPLTRKKDLFFALKKLFNK